MTNFKGVVEHQRWAKNEIGKLWDYVKKNQSSSTPGGGNPSGGAVVETTYTDLVNTLIPNEELVVGTVYKVLDIHSDQNTRAFPVNGYFTALSPTTLNPNGIGEFIEPRYDNIPIANRGELDGVTILTGYYAWGNKVWFIAASTGLMLNEFNLGGGFMLVNSKNDSQFNNNYETSFDEIYYDVEWDCIFSRHNKNTNVKVSRSKYGYSDLELIEYVRFNQDIKQELVGKFTITKGFVNVEIIDAFIYPNVVNFNGYVNTLKVGSSCELSIEAENNKIHKISNCIIDNGGSAYFYYGDCMLIKISDVEVSGSGVFDYYAEATPLIGTSSFTRDNYGMKASSGYININEGDVVQGVSNLYAVDGGSINLNRIFGAGACAFIHSSMNSSITLDSVTTILKNINVEGASSLSGTINGNITDLYLRSGASASNTLIDDLFSVEIIGQSLDFSTLTGPLGYKLYSALTT